MKVKEVRYQRVKNLGNYESARLELVAELNEDDDVTEAIANLKATVNLHLGIDSDSVGEDDNPF